MQFIHSALPLLAATTSTTSKAGTSSSSGSPFLLIIIVLFALLYFFMIRPNQRRRTQAMRQARSFDLGDEVVAAGMVGRVVRIGDGEVDIEVSPGVVVQFVTQAVQLRTAFVANQQARAGGRGAFGRQAPPPPPQPTPTDEGPVIDVADTRGSAQANGASGEGAADGAWPTSGEK